jgi:transcriptional regulator with XRE-family HTH domain
MANLEQTRLCYGMTKRQVCAEIGVYQSQLRAWMSGRTVGSEQTVARIKEFLERKSV